MLKRQNYTTFDTHHFWIAEPITDSHPLKVDFHFGSGVVFMDVISNCRNILSCIRLQSKREVFILGQVLNRLNNHYALLEMKQTFSNKLGNPDVRCTSQKATCKLQLRKIFRQYSFVNPKK